MLFCIKFFLGENADINQFLQFLHRLDLFFHRHGCRVRGGSSGFRCRRRCRRLNRGGGHRIDGLRHIHTKQHAAIAKAVVLNTLRNALLGSHIASLLGNALVCGNIHLIRGELLHELT